jgi:tRNA (adenine22-N1)-methyltransferase
MELFIKCALSDMPFWDICCDHGQAGIGAARSNRFTEIHLVDQLPHVMENLEVLVLKLPPEYRMVPYFFYATSGQSISKTILGNCLIAGVGGLTMRIILKGLLDEGRLKAKRLILCPHTDEVELVSFLSTSEMQTQYELVERRMIAVGKKMKPLFILNSKV